MTLFLFFISKMMQIVRTAASGVGPYKLPYAERPPTNCIRRHIAQTAPVCTQHTSHNNKEDNMTPQNGFTLPDNYWTSPQSRFTTIPNTVLQDSNLSLSAKGLYMLFASKMRIPNENFQIHPSNLKAASAQHSLFEMAKQELINAGYLYYFQLSGKQWKNVYILLDKPITPDPTDHSKSFKDLSSLRVYAQTKLGICLENSSQVYNYYAVPTHRYTKVPDQMIMDTALKLSDKGMYGVLASRIFSPGWNTDLRADIDNLSSPREHYTEPKKRLEDNHYLISVQFPRSDGQKAYCYLLFATPTVPAIPLKRHYISPRAAQDDVHKAFGITLTTSVRTQKHRKNQDRETQDRETTLHINNNKSNNNNTQTNQEVTSIQLEDSPIRVWAEYRDDKYADPECNAIYQLVVHTLETLVGDDQTGHLFRSLKNHLHFDREGVCDLSEEVEELAEKIAPHMRNNDIRHKIPYIRTVILNHFGWNSTNI